ncbi:hypothetical protein O9X80_11175 [Agrobacterium salinitolerans]|uniref:hypothetical protein n=1 Tax=Agrobacterium salinitolerans TaxID=1183413 RepID=UPI0022B81EF5|nr:hypothetical protein [Agrobacterium salinitolerans]MCZ7975049.1 hypothetical protein [Agrobacterium salinitolerans]
MESEANNPGSAGTGYTAEEAMTAFSSILESEASDDVVADDVVETVENDDQEIEQVDESDDEQSEWNSEADEEIDGDGSESVEPSEDETAEVPAIADDAKVTLANGETVDFKELKDGYLRMQDYTVGKTQLAREIEETKVARYQLGQSNQEYVKQLKEVVAYEFQLMNPAKLEELRQSDPYEYAEQMDKYQKREEFLRQFHAWEGKNAEEMIAREQEVFKANQLKARDELIAIYPEFGKQETAKPLLHGMTNMMVNDYGISLKELEEVADSRLLRVIYDLHKAKQVKAATSEAKKVLAETPKVTTPKATNSTVRKSKDQAAREEVRRTGSSDAATRYFESIL